MADGAGYTIDAGGAEGQAQALDKAAADEDKIHFATLDPVCYVADTFGGEDADPAYHNFSSAWQTETTVIASALKELAEKVRASAAHYQRADRATTADLQKATAPVIPAPAVATSARKAAAGGDYRPFG